MYNKVSKEIIESLKDIVGPVNITFDEADLVAYSRDLTVLPRYEYYKYRPEVIVHPRSTEEVSKILQLANIEKVPVTPRGGGSTLSGGAMPRRGGILLDMCKMDKIQEIDEENMCATVQSGIVISTLESELNKKGLICGHIPVSWRVATIGGAISTDGWGMYIGFWGSMGEQVLGLKVVLPDGEVIKVGAGGALKVGKSSCGYKLRELFTAAFGTLGIITEATIRIFKKPEAFYTISVTFEDVDSAIRAASRIRKLGARTLLSLTLNLPHKIDDAMIKIFPTLPETTTPAIGFTLAGLKGEVEGAKKEILKICRSEGGLIGKPSILQTRRQRFPSAKLDDFELFSWMPRKHSFAGITFRSESTEDTAVPFSNIIKAMKSYQEAAYKLGIKGFTCESAIILFPDYLTLNVSWQINENDEKSWEQATKFAREIQKICIELGGTISNSHGMVFRLETEDMYDVEFSNAMNVIWKIKKALDPNYILNPGKMYLDPAYEIDVPLKEGS